jgi:hypothetical protein
MAGLYAGAQIGNEQMLKGARDAEVAKLGPAGPARVTAVQSFLEAQLGSDLGKVMGTMLVTAQARRGLREDHGCVPQSGRRQFSPPRSPNEPAKVSAEQYAR